MPRKKCKIVKSKSPKAPIVELQTRRPEVRTIMTIFREIHDIHSHERLQTQLMLEFYNKLTIDDFCQDFFECMRHIMIYQDRIKTEVPFLFCIKFTISCLKKDVNCSDSPNNVLLMKRMVKFITWYESDNDTNVRFHCVQVARILLTELTDDMPVPESLFEKIQELLLKRFWDVKSYVRAEAARASSRLQDPSDAECPIVVALMHLCRFDGCHTVRLAAMQALAITTKTLPCIAARCRDINDLVRKKSFDLLSKWKILKPLTVSKRLQIIEAGLTDKSECVKNSCTELLRVWLVASGNDAVALLKRFDVENMEEATELALTHLLASMANEEVLACVDSVCSLMDERKVVREQSLNAEVAFLWRHLVIFLSDHSAQYGDALDRILPSVPDFEQYLRRLFQKPIEQSSQREISLDEYAEYCTIIKQLLPIVKYIDIFDPYNHKKIMDLIKWAMSSTDIPFNYVEHLMKLLVYLESNNVKICDETVALINELLFDNETTDNRPPGPTDKDKMIPQRHENTEATDGDEYDHVVVVVNKEALRKKRIEIAELEVQINELRESITTSMQAKELDHVQAMVNELMILESKKSELVMIRDQMMSPVDNKKIQEIVMDTVELTPVVKKEGLEPASWMAAGMESRIIKANIMTITMIQECNMLWTMPPSLRSLVDNVILISVRHTDVCVRQKAILSLGLCCLLDKELALKYYPIFLKSLEIDYDQIKEVAVRSLIDLFIRFGIEPFQDILIAAKENSRVMEQSSVIETMPDIKRESFASANNTTMGSVELTEEEQNRCVAELLNPIIILLNSDKTELQTTASIGLSKLLYHHKLMSSKLLSRLLLLWFNPDTENNVLLRQHLAGFFSSYSLMSADNQHSITGCVMITMRTLFKASLTSRLSEVDVTNVIEFFLRVTDSKYLLDNRPRKDKTEDNTGTIRNTSLLDNPCHDELAVTISNQILKGPLSNEVKYYVVMLVRLRLSPKNVDIIGKVESLVAAIIKKLKDKKSIQLLEKFHREVLSTKIIVKDLSVNMGVERDVSLSEVNRDVIMMTPISKPILLEVNTVGKPQDGRFLSHTMINVANTTMNESGSLMSSLSSIDANDDTLLDQTMTDRPPMIGSIMTTDNDTVVNNNPLPQPMRDEDIFKKPRNVRVTRSSSRCSDTSSLSGGSVLSMSATSTTRPRRVRNTDIRR